ncbi:MAG: DUF126 domain-containing protein [Halanaerobiales bacterium]|nr:DUF126 domain-containing protein [Halanaerobiales bacterium]
MKNYNEIILKGRKVIGGKAEGEAIVSKIPLMGWGNVDPKRGITTERNHPLYNIPLKDKILVFPEPRGSGGFVIYGAMKRYGTNPAAMLYTKGLALTVLAAMSMDVPTITDFDQDPVKQIETGDYVKVDADKGIVRIIKK